MTYIEIYHIVYYRDSDILMYDDGSLSDNPDGKLFDKLAGEVEILRGKLTGDPVKDCDIHYSIGSLTKLIALVSKDILIAY